MHGHSISAAALVALLCLFASVDRGVAQELPTHEPLLRIEPGMHTGAIRRIGVDAACTLLATGSDDKTVRVWRLPEGRLLRTLRPPIDTGNGGKIFALAVAPDGSWIASGGWDAAYSAGQGHSVYLFDATTGGIVARLGPQNEAILNLAVSPNGRLLAATHRGGAGVRVWQRTGPGIGTWSLVMEDKDYGRNDAAGAVFDSGGSLYTVADDGRLRRYGAGLTAKPISVVLSRGKEPSAVAMHPIGDRVAVGFQDAPAVEIYDARTLVPRLKVDTKGIDNGSLSSVAWSADGERLFAGGRYARNNLSPIRVWDGAGTGAAREIQGPTGSIVHLVPCADSIAVGGQDPAYGLLAPDGSRRLWHDSVQADLRSSRLEHFTVSSNGREVRFGLRWGGGEPVLFNLSTAQLSDAPQAIKDLFSADTFSADTQSLPITDWVGSRAPKLAGRPVQLEAYERVRSLAISPDKRRFVLGTDWALRFYDTEGRLLWRRAIPDVAWGVNIARDGNVAVAAYGDGTVRWHRLSDGEELLALFVHAKDRRWVAWTPKGYYAASAGGESLIGWHVNRGWNEAADFFPAASFRDRFYRPDIVQLVLDTLDEEAAIERANVAAKRSRDDQSLIKRLPPVVEILSPRDGASIAGEEITLEYMVRSPSGSPVTHVRAFIDDRPATPRSPIGGGRLKLQVPVPPRDATLSLVAYTEASASEPARIQLRWMGLKAEGHEPKLYALVIGIAKYDRPMLNLKFAAKDADDFATALSEQEGKAFRKVVVQKLTDESATRDNIMRGLWWLKENVKDRDDYAVFFFSGHGVTTPGRSSHLLPRDVEPTDLDVTGIDQYHVREVLRGLPGKAVAFLDASHASDGTEEAGIAGARRFDTIGFVNEFSSTGNGVLVFSSTSADEQSYESESWNNGAFTKAIIEGLRGSADFTKEGQVDDYALGLWLRRRVPALTNGRQTPVWQRPPTGSNFTLAKLVTIDPAVPSQPSNRELDIEIIRPSPSRGALPLSEPEIEFVGRVRSKARVTSLLVGDKQVALDAVGRFSTKLVLKPGRNQLWIVALTDGEPLVKPIELNYAAEQSGALPTGERYALVIGNSQYTGWNVLPTPIKDAEAIGEVLREKFAFSTTIRDLDDKPRDLILKNAKKQEILEVLYLLENQVSTEDTVIIYFAGHGEYEDATGTAYWIPSDARRSVIYTYLGAHEVRPSLQRMKARKVVIVADSCFSGAFREGDKAMAPRGDQSEASRLKAVEQERRFKSRLLLSSGANEPVLDGGGNGHSIFARAFLDGLEKMPHQVFWLGELYTEYIKVRVSGNAAQSPQFGPIREAGHEGGDLVLHRVRAISK